MENSQPGISSRVKQFRTDRAWSQEQLANICGISVRTIQRLENRENASFETLKAIANAFDLDVRDLTEGQVSSTDNNNTKKTNVIFMRRITSGRELYSMMSGTHAYRLQNDELDTAEEVELVGRFLQDVSDTGDCLDDMEPMHKVEQGYRFTQMIDELEAHGLWVFAVQTRTRHQLSITEMEDFSMRVVNIAVIRDTNPTIIKRPTSAEVVAAILNS